MEVACWAHARRKFFDARTNDPREAHQGLEWIWQLYDIEDRAWERTPGLGGEMRCAEANPVLDKIEAYLATLTVTVLPKSVLAKAVSHARNQWQALRCYPCEGRLTNDNNPSKRTLRPQAIGRNNWLFLGREQAGPGAAILYTVLAGAKRHRLQPWVYVRNLLSQIAPNTSSLEELLADRWATHHPESVLSYRLEESRRKAAAQRERRQSRRAQTSFH